MADMFVVLWGVGEGGISRGGVVRLVRLEVLVVREQRFKRCKGVREVGKEKRWENRPMARENTPLIYLAGNGPRACLHRLTDLGSHPRQTTEHT